LTLLKNPFRKDARWDAQIAVKGVLTSQTASSIRQTSALTAAVSRAFSDYRNQPKKAETW